jgi:hypothetical protein
MAAGQFNRERRALLGAAVSMPLVSRHPGLDPGSTFSGLGDGAERWIPDQVRGDEGGVRDDGEWEQALATLRAAEETLARVEAATAGYRFDEEEAVLPGHKAACSAVAAAVRGVMGTAAPDFAAFAVKLELLFGYEFEPHSVEDEILAALRGDLGRLAARDALPLPSGTAAPRGSLPLP